MTQKEVLEQLKSIVDKMEANLYRVWDTEMEYTSDCVILQDIDYIVYNGWSEDLQNLVEQLEKETLPENIT
jgi:hypothetical protein